jgi:transcriptional regulator with XRE-family HTH domain
VGYRRDVDPTASAAALYAHKLRAHRDAKGWTQDSLADRVACTGDLISKLETAKRSATRQMSRSFDQIFGLDGYFEDLQPLAARELALGWFRPFLEAEAIASTFHIFEPMVVTGLLQTEEYARVVLSAGNHPDKVDQLVATRMQRQEVLSRADPPWLVLLMAEYAVRRRIGGPEVARAQLERLLEEMKAPNVTIQIVPEDAPIYLNGSFTLMSFEGGREVAYAESAIGQGSMIDQQRSLGALKVSFDLIRAAALPAATSEKLIRTIRESV